MPPPTVRVVITITNPPDRAVLEGSPAEGVPITVTGTTMTEVRHTDGFVETPDVSDVDIDLGDGAGFQQATRTGPSMVIPPRVKSFRTWSFTGKAAVTASRSLTIRARAVLDTTAQHVPHGE